VSSSSVHDGLARLEESLQALISGLESEPLPGADVLDSIWRRVQQGFAAVQAGLARDGRVHEHQREPLERCQRLHVLAAGLSVRRREQVAAERQACAGLHARLRAARREAANGGSCNVSA
jgi:hypothetical protein